MVAGNCITHRRVHARRHDAGLREYLQRSLDLGNDAYAFAIELRFRGVRELAVR